MFRNFKWNVVFTAMVLLESSCSSSLLGADRDDITNVLPENVMLYGDVNCQQIIQGQEKLDLPFRSLDFDGVFWETVFLPMGLQIGAIRGFDSLNLQRFVGQHALFAQRQGSAAFEFAFVTDEREQGMNVFQAVASFKLKDRQAYEDFVAEHLDAWNESLMEHADVESESHKETGVTFHEFRSPFGPKKDEMYAVPVAYTWWFDGRVWMSTSQDLAEKMIGRCEAPGEFKSLARDNGRFRIVAKTLDTDQDELASRFFLDYLNTFEQHPIWNYGINHYLNGQVDRTSKSRLRELKAEFGRDFELPYRDNLALWAEIRSSEDRSRWHGSANVLYAVPRRDRLSKMRLQLPKNWQVEAWLPESATTYATTQFDPASDPEAVRELSTRMLGMDWCFRDAGQELIDPILRQLSEPQRQELASQVTGRFTTVASAGYESKMIMLELKDAQQPFTWLTGVAAKWQEEADEVEAGKRKLRRERYTSLKTEKYQDVDIYYGHVHFPSESYKNSYMAVYYATPAVAKIGNNLVFSNDREFLKAAIDQHTAGKESEFVRVLQKRAAASADVKHSELMIYSKAPNLSRIAYDWLRVPPADKIAELTSPKVREPNRLMGPHDYLHGIHTLATKMIERVFTDPDEHALITVSQTEKSFEIQFSIK